MTRHVLDGMYYSVVHSDATSSCTPLDQYAGPHWAVWVFEIQEAHIALAPPWGAPGYTEHRDLLTLPPGDLRRARLAVVAQWPAGYLSQGGTGRLYFDPRSDVRTSARDQQARLAALEQEGLGQQPRPDKDPLLLQHALLKYVFTGQAGGPPAAFRSIGKWLPSYVAAIDVAVAYEERTGAEEAQGEGQQFTITVGPAGDDPARQPLGRLGIRPRWSQTGRRVRLLGADPPLRDDLLLAEDNNSSWNDPAVPTPAGSGHAELSYFHWSWSASEGEALAPPEQSGAATGPAPAGPASAPPAYR